MRRRKKRRIRWKKIILLLLFLIIIIGGSIKVFQTFKHKKDNTKKEVTEIKKESNDIKEEPTTKNLENAPKNHQEFLNLEDGEYLTEKGLTLTIKNKIAYVDNYIIVNKTYSVPNTFIPENPNAPVTAEKCNNCINKDAWDSFQLMQSDAKSIGLNIYISSGYRSYNYQDNLYNNYVRRSGKEQADTYSARPGHSEHQTGTCFDLNTIDDSFANTEEGKWVNNNAANYGFIIRYPKGKEKITGYQYESWHLRYVGKELANKLYQNDTWQTLEEYFGISSSYE